MGAPQTLVPDHKELRVQACSNVLECNEAMGYFLDCIDTGDEIWAHHYELE
jgi:hypothetical protein